MYRIINHNSFIVPMYVVGDSEKFSEQFSILQCSIIVLENKVSMKRRDRIITIVTVDDETTFAFYRRFFPLDGLSVSR